MVPLRLLFLISFSAATLVGCASTSKQSSRTTALPDVVSEPFSDVPPHLAAENVQFQSSQVIQAAYKGDADSSSHGNAVIGAEPIKLADDDDSSSSKMDSPATEQRPRFPIDLPTALRLADAENLQVMLARAQVQQSYAEYRQTDAMWLPSLRSGVHYNQHQGPLLSSSGEIRDTSRSSVYTGLGATSVGGGSPAIPGVLVNFHLADAMFQPLAALQRLEARKDGARAAKNDMLLDVATSYTELLRAEADIAITSDLLDKTRELSRIMDAYQKTGQGLQSDADRMRVELGIREMDVSRSIESSIAASTRMCQLLRLDPCFQLTPIDQDVLELRTRHQNCECGELVAIALQNRPELAQSKHIVCEAVERLRRESYATLVPSLVLAASYGGFGGGQGSTISNFDDRLDFDATVFWEVRNLGYGESAVRDVSKSRVQQARIQVMSAMDQIAREVTEANARLKLRQEQISMSRQLVKHANDSYQQNLIRVRAGHGLPIESLQSLQALLQSRREYLRAITDYNIAQFTLQRATGWPIDENLVAAVETVPAHP